MMNKEEFIRAAVHVPVKNLGETIAWYRDRLGFTSEWTEGHKDGGIGRDGLRLLFGEDPAHVAKINDGVHSLNLLWFASGIDKLYEEFLARDITIVSPLKPYSYGLREFAFLDLNGYYIRVAEPYDATGTP